MSMKTADSKTVHHAAKTALSVPGWAGEISHGLGRNFVFCAPQSAYNSAFMADARIEELRTLLPRAMLPDWVRLGARLVRLLRHYHPSSHDAVLERLLQQARDSVALRERRAANLLQVQYPPDLPICARKQEIISAIRKHQVVVIAGETGSGKTTQLPKMCLEAGFGIGRGSVAPSPAASPLYRCRGGSPKNSTSHGVSEVGCKIRFADQSSPETYIKLMTDGMLLAETQGDPLLSEYDVHHHR